MHLDKFVKTTSGKTLMSIILGLGLATLFRAVCKGRRCNIVSAPPLDEIDGQIYKFNKKCYKLEKGAITCDSNKKTVRIRTANV